MADGMGGANGGHIASRVAVDEAVDVLTEVGASNRIDEEMMVSAVVSANHAVYNRAQDSDDLYGMGTTIVVAAVSNETAIFCHVGDSRGYLFRDGQLSQITKDHSVVQNEIDAGMLTQEEAENVPYKNVLTRSIGPEADVEPTTAQVAIGDTDLLLLCSDGLSGFVSHKELEEILKAHSHNLMSSVRILTETAAMRGSTDNITAVLAVNQH